MLGLGVESRKAWLCSQLCLLQYSGTWYPKAMVHNGSLPNHKIPGRVFPVRVIAMEEGDLEATVTMWYVFPTGALCHFLSLASHYLSLGN